MPPSNTTAGTAVDITVLPYTITQSDIHDAGTTYNVWYKCTISDDGIYGVLGWGGAVYTPYCSIYGPDSSVLIIVSGGFNKAMQFYGYAGSTYYFKFTTNSGNPTPAVLDISVIQGPNDTIPDGAIFISDDTPGLPAAVIDPTNGDIVRFIGDFPAGEEGDSILTPTPLYAFADGASFPDIRLYNSAFVNTSTFTPLGTDRDPLIRANRSLNKIYVLGCDTSDDWILQSIDSASTVSGALTTIILGTSGVSVKGFCVANDANRVYIGHGSPNVLKVWSISGVAFGTDLFTGLSATDYCARILVLEDDTVVTLWIDVSSGQIYVRTFNSAGTLLNTFDYGTANTHTLFQHLAYAADSPNSFWLWTHPFGAGTSRFRRVKVSDGSNLADFTIPEFESGEYGPTASATPTARFGPSLSCPIFLISGVAVGSTNPNISQIAVEMISLPPDLAGIYFINPSKATKHDSYYHDNEKKIPQPTIRTALIGE